MKLIQQRCAFYIIIALSCDVQKQQSEIARRVEKCEETIRTQQQCVEDYQLNVTRLRDQLTDLEKMINTKVEQHAKRVHELQDQVRIIKEYVLCTLINYLYLSEKQQK